MSLISTLEGINFVPKGELTKREYLEHYRLLVKQVFAPEAYFERIVPAVLALRGISHRTVHRLLRTHLGTFLRLIYNLGIKGQGYRSLFWKAFFRVLWKNPAALEAFGHDCFYFFHLNRHADFIDRELSRHLASAGPDDVLDRVIQDARPKIPASRLLPLAV